jgi:hypothetical protein
MVDSDTNTLTIQHVQSINKLLSWTSLLHQKFRLSKFIDPIFGIKLYQNSNHTKSKLLTWQEGLEHI